MSLLRWLARLLVAGPDGRFILDDLDEAHARDRSAGRSRVAAALRYLSAALRSAWATRSHLAVIPVSTLDLRLAARGLRRHPVVSAVAVLSMVVGIPLGLVPTLIADATDSPPPFEDGERLVGIRYAGARTTSFDFQHLSASTSSLGEIVAFRLIQQNFALDGESVAAYGAEVSPGLFSILRVPPTLGRTLLPSDRAGSGPRVVLLGHRLWANQLGADPDIVGRNVTIGGGAVTVVGVMPEGFAFPQGQQFWLPLHPNPAPTPGDAVPLVLMARLPDEANVGAIEAELATLVTALGSEHPGSYERARPEVVGLNAALIGLPKAGIRSDLAFRILGLWAFSIIAVACVNIGLLMYARSVSRRRENSIRSALGASRKRIVGQVFAEVLVLSSLSTAVGLGLLAFASFWALQVFPQLVGAIPYWIEPRVTPRLVLSALFLAIASAVAASLVPAWKATKEMRGPSRSFGRTTSVLVVLDIAVAITVAGVAAGVFERVDQVRTGMGLGPVPDESILAAIFTQPGPLSGAYDAGEGFGEEVRAGLVEALRADPRVQDVAVASALPRMSHRGARVVPEGLLPEGRSWVSSLRVTVAPGFFEALDIPILEGRNFEPADTSSALRPVVVNRTFVDSVLAGRAPIGRRIDVLTSTGETEGLPLEVIGLVPDAGTDLIDPLDGAAFYEVGALSEVNPFMVGIRVDSDPAAFAPRLREITRDVAPHVLLVAGPLAGMYQDDWLLMIAFGAFFSVGLVILIALVVSGVYAILSFVVTSGRQDLGVRRALGAEGIDLAIAVTTRLRRHVLIGGLLGVPGAVYFYRMLIEGPTAGLEMVVVGIGAGLLVVSLVGVLGAVGPVRTALGVAPVEVMKG